jgi:hypothetical protein
VLLAVAMGLAAIASPTLAAEFYKQIAATLQIRNFC